MNQYDSASAILLPHGKDEGKLFAIKPTNGDFDLDVVRDGFSMYINEDGLFEPLLPNHPLIDFRGGGCPKAKLQPQRTRLNEYPTELFRDYYTKSGARIEGDPSTAGSELITNGNFTGSATGWTLGGTAVYGTDNIVVTGNASQTNYLQQAGIAGSNSELYKFVYEITNSTAVGSNYLKLIIGTNIINESEIDLDCSVGVHTLYFNSKSTGTASVIQFRSNSTFISGTLTIDNVSVKEVEGFEAPMLEAKTGDDLLDGWDFTNGWTDVSSTILAANSFTTVGAGGVRNAYLTVGNYYKIIISGITTAAGLSIRNSANTHIYISGLSGAFSETVYFKAETDGLLYLRNSGAGTTDITTFMIVEILPGESGIPMRKAWKLVESNGINEPHAIERAFPFTNGISYPFVYYAKADERSKIIIKSGNNSTYNITATFDLIAGTVNAIAGSASIEPLINGWFKCSVVGLSSSTASTNARLRILNDSGNEIYVGDGISGIKLFFPQLEQGSYPTYPIWDGNPAGTLTRVVDEITLSDLQTNNILSNTEGAWLVEFGDIPIVSGNSVSRLFLSDGNGSSGIKLGFNSSDDGKLRIRANAADEEIDGALMANSKALIRFKSTGVDVFYNGTKQALATIDSEIITGITDIETLLDISQLEIKKMIFFKTAPSDAKCSEYTS